MIFADFQKTRVVVWPFNPATGNFGDAITSPLPAPSVESTPEPLLTWISEGSSLMRVWPTGHASSFEVSGMQIRSSDTLTFNRDLSRVLRKNAGGEVELWAIDGISRKASLRSPIKVSRLDKVEFSSDNSIVVARQVGGALFGWTREGKELGFLGSAGSDVIWSTYDPKCERILLWTSEGLRYDWRRGWLIPIYGFLPSEKCDSDAKLPVTATAIK